MSDPAGWGAFALALALVLGWEWRALARSRRQPMRIARAVHARMRVSWVAALSGRAGFEIVAVQSLRNSLMSATIAASTSALALMGTASLASSTLGQHAIEGFGRAELRMLLEAMLMGVLFASYVCSAMAMRYFNHAGFVMSMPHDAPQRKPLEPMAAHYVERAGVLYSWGLRFFLMVAPMVGGIVHPFAMPPLALVLIGVLIWFDRPAPMAERAVTPAAN